MYSLVAGSLHGKVHRACGMLAIVAVMFLVSPYRSQATAAEIPVCAILDASDLAVRPVLEARLLEKNNATWVERTEIERVLQEQELSNAFGAADGSRRAALGKLLKADVLILLRSQQNPDPKEPELIQCIVCETRQGLRLRAATVPSGKDLDGVADELEQAILRGLQKRERPIEAIVAVPPFLSDDLTFENNHLQAAYARLVEQVLLERPGVVVVELTEAQAIAREIALDKSGNGLQQRGQALYLMGRYRHDSVDNQKRLRMSLRLLRGDEQLTLKGVRDLAPADAASWILKKTAELSELLQTDAKVATPSAEDEARRLSARAKDFQRVGNWEEAYALYEASLLLQDTEATRQKAVIVAGKLALHLWGREHNLERRMRAMALYERGLEHLEMFLRTADELSKYQHKDGGDFVREFDTLLYMHIAHPDNPPEIQEHVRHFRGRRTDAYLRMARMRADAGRFDRGDNEAWDVRAVWMLPQEEQLAAVLRVAKEWKDLPDIRERILRMAHRGYVVPENTLVLHQFLADLPKASPHAEAAASILRQRLAENEIRMQEEAKRRPGAKIPVDPAIKQLELQPDPEHIAKWESRPEKFISGVLPLGEDADLFWAGQRYFVMDKGTRKVRYVFDVNELVVGRAYDGKYVWFAIFENRRMGALLAIELATGKRTRFSADDGLPFVDGGFDFNYLDRMQVAAVAPGHVCLAAFIERTWIANVKLAVDGKKQVDIFHEAREAANSNDTSQEGSTKVAFQPTFMFALRGEDDNACRILLGRQTSHTAVRKSPLLIDPHGRTVTVADYSLPGDTQRDLITANRDSVYVLRQNYPRGPKLMRVVFPGEKMELFLEDAPDGKLAALRDRLEVIGKKWWTIDFEKPVIQERTAGVAWHHGHMFFVEGVDNSADGAFVEGRDGDRIYGAAISNHFGALAIVRIKGRDVFFDFEDSE